MGDVNRATNEQGCEKCARLERDKERYAQWFRDAEANKNHYKKRLMAALEREKNRS